MDGINLNSILQRIFITKNIQNDINDFYNNVNKKRGIYVYGDNGIGKTKFILNLLKDLNYDVIYYDNSFIRNKLLINNICSGNLGHLNVYNLLNDTNKKKVIVIDDIDSMNYGDKSGIISLIKLIRIKKTKKQKLELTANCPIICINNLSNDKKILELMKVCITYKLENPTNNQLLEILNTIIPDLLNNTNYNNDLLKTNILNYLNNNLNNIEKLLFYHKHDLIYDKFILNYRKNINNNIQNIKFITQKILSCPYKCHESNDILETDRTIISLLYHENIFQLLNNNNSEIYLKILDNFIFSDYIDRIIFQKQIWQLTEMNFLIKIFYNNYIINQNNLFKNIDIYKILFTKVLTKYSSEFNNYVFIYKLLQNLLIDKKDLLLLYNNTNDEEILNSNNILNDLNNINKMDIVRFNKLIDNIVNYKYINNKNIDIEESNMNNIINNIDNIDNINIVDYIETNVED